MTDSDRLLAVAEIWDLIKAGRRSLDALYEYERLALERQRRTPTEPCPPPEAE